MEKVNLNIQIVIFDKEEEFIEKTETRINIESNKKPKLAKDYFKLLEVNNQDIIEVINNYLNQLPKERKDNIGSYLINFFTETWDYLTSYESSFESIH